MKGTGRQESVMGREVAFRMDRMDQGHRPCRNLCFPLPLCCLLWSMRTLPRMDQAWTKPGPMMDRELPPRRGEM